MGDFMGNVLLNMEIKGASIESIEHIQAKLPSVKYISLNESNGIQNVQFEYGKNKDPREELFWCSLIDTLMKQSGTNLEDIFRDLTMEGKKDV